MRYSIVFEFESVIPRGDLGEEIKCTVTTSDVPVFDRKIDEDLHDRTLIAIQGFKTQLQSIRIEGQKKRRFESLK